MQGVVEGSKQRTSYSMTQTSKSKNPEEFRDQTLGRSYVGIRLLAASHHYRSDMRTS